MLRLRITLAVVVAMLAALVAVNTGDAQAPPSPAAPLVLAQGQSVMIAWRLPAQPRPVTIVLYRRTVGGTLGRIGEFPAAQLSYIDKDVAEGASYEYAVAAAYRKGPVSAISAISPVSIAGGAKITLVGGSITQAVFEVTIFDQGRKVTAQFVNTPGQPIGDLHYVASAGKTLDFRLGSKLLSLDVAEISGVRPTREPLLDATGKPMLDLAGQPLSIELKLPGETREVLTAQIITGDGRTIMLNEGDSIDG